MKDVKIIELVRRTYQIVRKPSKQTLKEWEKIAEKNGLKLIVHDLEVLK